MKYIPVPQNISSPIALLLAIFCLNMGYCVFQKITFGDFYQTEIAKQPKSVVNSSTSNTCSLDEKVINISVSEIERSVGTDLPILASSIIFRLPNSVEIGLQNLTKDRIPSLISSIPLFLKNRRLII